MTDRWRRVEEVFHAALEQPEERRATFVAEACAGDDLLREEVESLLATAESTEAFLETPALPPRTVRLGQHVGAYRIDAFLGEGGMAEVYRAHDARLGRDVALKLLPPLASARDDRVRRFMQEARAASALNHPNIVTIHEVGDVEGVPFIAQELVQGETLRERLRRGPLALADALDIAAQVATALAAAHSAGIVHRDIKPENVMVRPDGYVKVLDFGVAKLAERVSSEQTTLAAPRVRTGTGVIVGTTGYMSPEQVRGAPVDARSDVFSLGVVLYEMLTGEPPFDGESASDVLTAILRDDPPLPSHKAAAVPTEVDDLLVRLLQKNPDARPQSADDVRQALQTVRAALSGTYHTSRMRPPRRRTRRTAALGVASLAIVTLAIITALLSTRHPPALAEQDTILLTDFVNTTGDTVFDGSTLRQGLAIQLRQTPYFTLIADEAIRTTLTMMARPPGEGVTPAVGLEMCRRLGLKAMVTGRIARLGRAYVISLEAVDGRSGETVASEQVQAGAQEDVLRALGHAATALRRQLGESLATLERYNAPLEQATTSSLEALQAYSGGLEHIHRENGPAALPFFVRATELDPQFVAAHDWGAWAHIMSGSPSGAARFAERAYQHRARATEREKISAAATYHHFVTGDLDEENRQCEIWKRLFPNDWVAYSCPAFNYLAIGRFEEAAREARHILRLSPNVSQGYRFLAPALMHLGQLDEAAAVLAQARERQIDNVFLRRIDYQLAVLGADPAAAERAIDRIQQHDGENAALTWQARTLMTAGRRREARDRLLRARRTTEATLGDALVGWCDRAAVAALMAPARITGPLLYVPGYVADGSLCGNSTVAEQFADALAARFPRSTEVTRLSVPAFRATIALANNQPERAFEALREATLIPQGVRFLPAYLRGYAHLHLGRGADAAGEFQTILTHRAWDPTSPLYPLASLGLARAAAVDGDVTASRRAYERFFDLWNDADADLPVLIAAKQEYAQLPSR